MSDVVVVGSDALATATRVVAKITSVISEVTNEAEYIIAGEVRTHTIRKARLRLDRELDPEISRLKSELKKVGERKQALFAHLGEKDAALKESMERFLVEQRELQIGQQQAVVDNIMRAATADIAQEAERLFDFGDDEGAMQVLKATPDLPTFPKTKPYRPAGAADTIREVWSWELVDKNLLHNEYLTPDTVRISSAVRSHKGDAEAVVGMGSIRVLSRPSVGVGRQRKLGEK